MNRQRFVKNILKMENEWLAADLVQLARKNPEQIRERGVKNFNDLQDLRATLNWNLNGDSAKYQFRWGQSGRNGTTGYAYVFD
jgi:hypothetical protein